jgi:putative SOS response-associated peptidase YedK
VWATSSSPPSRHFGDLAFRRVEHDRQPAILDPAAYDAWLDPATPADIVKPLLDRNLDGTLEFHRVSRAVNSTKDRSDSAIMIEPINPQ